MCTCVCACTQPLFYFTHLSADAVREHTHISTSVYFVLVESWDSQASTKSADISPIIQQFFHSPTMRRRQVGVHTRDSSIVSSSPPLYSSHQPCVHGGANRLSTEVRPGTHLPARRQSSEQPTATSFFLQGSHKIRQNKRLPYVYSCRGVMWRPDFSIFKLAS